MAKTKIKLSYKGIGNMLRGPEMASLVGRHGASIATNAGEGFGYRVHNTGQRQACNVFPETSAASKDNLENNALLKAIR